MNRNRSLGWAALFVIIMLTSGCVEAKPFEPGGVDADSETSPEPTPDSNLSETVDAPDAGPEVAECTPDCENKVCGDDGCGNVCGDCTEALPFCVEGQCTAECQPSCDGKECGGDGCGDVCGLCPGAAPYCTDGLCQTTCTPNCDGKECGDDGCGGDCGACPGAAPVCSEDFKCISEDCTPNCDDRVCGGDGCGGSCGECQDDDLACNGVPTCEPATGQCQDSEVPECDDENPCTVGACVEDVDGSGPGCSYTPNDEATCDDGDLCTEEDSCVDGLCLGTAVDCDQNSPCVVGSVCESASGECTGGTPKSCAAGETCVASAGGCAYAEESVCYAADGSITEVLGEQVHCALLSDADFAMGFTQSEDEVIYATDGGDAPTMQVGTYGELKPGTQDLESLIIAYSFLSFDSAWGIGAPKKPDHAIFADLILWEGEDCPTFSEEHFQWFKVLLLSEHVDEDSDQTLVDTLNVVGVDSIISEPPVWTPGVADEPNRWTFKIRLEPDQVKETIFKTLAIGMIPEGGDQDLSEAALEVPGLAEFQTKEGDYGPRLVLDYSECAPSCESRTCGSDGCSPGGCGLCSEDSVCVEQEASSFCCDDASCAEGATCGTTSCGLPCDVEPDVENAPCVAGQLTELGYGYTCGNSGCQIPASLDISYNATSKTWEDGEPIISLTDESGWPGLEREAFVYFGALGEALEVGPGPPEDSKLLLKLWFATGPLTAAPEVMAAIPSAPWVAFGEVDDSALNAQTGDLIWLAYGEPSEIADDGSYVYELALDLDDQSALDALKTRGLVIGSDNWEGVVQLLRSSESGHGPTLAWKGAACLEACEGKECGPDGCGGSCGVCSGDLLCDTEGEGLGTYQCVLGACDPGESFCEFGNVMTCNALGTGYLEGDFCGQAQLACLEVDSEMTCGQGAEEPLSSQAVTLTDSPTQHAMLYAGSPWFSGSDGYQQNSAMTLSLWVRLPESVQNGTIASYSSSGSSKILVGQSDSDTCTAGDQGWALFLEGDRLMFKTTDGVNKTARIAMTAPIMGAYGGSWVHLAVVSRGVEGEYAHANGNVQLYVNGVDRWHEDTLVLAESGSSGVYKGMTGVFADSAGLAIGRHHCPHAGANPLGQLAIAIDEVAFLLTALTGDQVLQLFAGGCGGSPLDLDLPNALFAWYRMGELYGSYEKLVADLEAGGGTFKDNVLQTGPIAQLLTTPGEAPSSPITSSCAAPASCEPWPGLEELQGCGPGCSACASGECTSMGWCEEPDCSALENEPAPGEGCAQACGSAPSGCAGESVYCGYGCGVGTCHHDSASDVAAYGDIGYVVVGTACTAGTSGCSVALWRYTNDGKMVDMATFEDLAASAFGFEGESGLEEEGLGVDVALDGSYRIVISGRTKTQYNAADEAGNWRPMLASINGQDLSVEWVWVDKAHFGAFTDLALVSSGSLSTSAGQGVNPWDAAVAVGYQEQYWWVDDQKAWKRGALRTTVVVVEGTPIGEQVHSAYLSAPSTLEALKDAPSGSYGGVDRASDGTIYTVHDEENAQYAGLDAYMHRFGESGPFAAATSDQSEVPLTSPSTSYSFVAIDSVGGEAWPDQHNRVFVAVESEAIATLAQETRVRRYRDDPDGLVLEENISVTAEDEGPAQIRGLCATGDSGFFLTGSMTTPSGLARPWVERRSAHGWPGPAQSPVWRQFYEYPVIDTNEPKAIVPGATSDAMNACVVSQGPGPGVLVTVGEVRQPNDLSQGAPADAYISPRALGSGKSACR